MIKFYIPKSLDASIFPEKIRDYCCYFIHKLCMSYKDWDIDENDFTRLTIKTMRKIIPQASLDEVIQCLKDNKIIDIHNKYRAGHFGRGYKIADEYKIRWTQYIPTKKVLIDNLYQYNIGQKLTFLPVHIWLGQWLEQVELDINVDEQTTNILEIYKKRCEKEKIQISEQEYIEQIKNSLQLIVDKHFEYNTCPYGRLHTNLTRLLEEYRRILKINNKTLCSIDISNSQPLFLYLVLRNRIEESKDKKLVASANTIRLYDGAFLTENPILAEIERYGQLVIKGNFYEYLQEKGKLNIDKYDRNKVKKMIYVYFFGDNKMKGDNNKEIRYVSKVGKVFEELFPNISKMIEKIKEDKFQRLAHILQKEESKFVIEIVCKRIMDEYVNIPILTIHDSLMSTQENILIVKNIFEEEFKKRYNIVPHLKQELY